jgi:hypothetical protein
MDEYCCSGNFRYWSDFVSNNTGKFLDSPPSGYGGLIILGPIGMMITGVTVSYLSLLIWIIGKKIRKEFVHKGLFYSAIAPLIILLLFMFPISILLG